MSKRKITILSDDFDFLPNIFIEDDSNPNKELEKTNIFHHVETYEIDTLEQENQQYRFVSFCRGDLDNFINDFDWADAIYFDYGAAAASVGYSLDSVIDYWNRFLLNYIKEHPSKEYYCFSLIDHFFEDEGEEMKELGVIFYSLKRYQ